MVRTWEHTVLERAVSRRLGGADLLPPGLPPAAVLVVRTLRDPRPRGLSLAGGLHSRPDAAWERAVRERLGELLHGAARPADGRLPPDAAAVLFVDEAEMWACLALDLLAGRALSRWWWRALLRGAAPPPVAALLVREACHVPAVFERLEAWRRLDELVASLVPADAAAVLAAIVDAHALPAALAAPRTAAVELPGHDRTRDLHTPRRLAPEIHRLLGVAFGLRRAPATVRSAAFVRHARNPRGRAPRPGFKGISDPVRGRCKGPARIAQELCGARIEVQGVSEGERRRDKGPARIAQELCSARTGAQKTPEGVRASRNGLESVSEGFRGHYKGSARIAQELCGAHTEAPGMPAGVREHCNDPARIAQALCSDRNELPVIPGGLREPRTGSDSLPAGLREHCNDPARIAQDLCSTHDDDPAAADPGVIAFDLGLEGVATRLGAVLYLVNVALHLELFDVLEGELEGELGGWALVELLGRALLPEADPGDAIWLVLAELDGRPPGTPPAACETAGAWLARTVPAVRARLADALDDAEDAALAALFACPGRLFVTATHVDLVADLEAISVAARRAGLDRDPGWVPVLGRFVQFHFEGTS